MTPSKQLFVSSPHDAIAQSKKNPYQPPQREIDMVIVTQTVTGIEPAAFPLGGGRSSIELHGLSNKWR